MFCNDTRSKPQPEIITLSDDEGDGHDHDIRLEQPILVADQSATVSIIRERPLSPSTFLSPPQHLQTPLTTTSGRNLTIRSYSNTSANIITHLATVPLNSAKRCVQEHEDVVPGKRLRLVSHQPERRPLKEPTQRVSPNCPSFTNTKFVANLSTSSSRNTSRKHSNGRISSFNSSTTSRPINLSFSATINRTTTNMVQDQLRLLQSSDVSSQRRQKRSNTIQLANSTTTQHHTLPTHSVNSTRSSHEQIPFTRLTSYCYEGWDPKAPSFEPQVFTARFKCSYGRCREVLSNNVSLMMHLWAHLIVDLSGDDNESSQGNKYIESMSSCPECLRPFRTLDAMQNHYDNVHSEEPSSDACLVCESRVDPRAHLSLHGEDDAPYHCRKCRYRTSIRRLLLEHFIRLHCNTRTLLCPFCLSTFTANCPSLSSTLSLPLNNNTLLVVKCPAFVHHMKKHKTAKLFQCPSCVLQFVRLSDRKAHTKDHSKKNRQWVSNPYKKLQPPDGRRVWPLDGEKRCLECNQEISNLQEHTRQIRTCARCCFSTACDDEYMHHIATQCTAIRSGFTRSRLLRSAVSCAHCGRRSAYASTIIAHLQQCDNAPAYIIDAQHHHISELSAVQEHLEVEHFAVGERYAPITDDWLPKSKTQKSSKQNVPHSVSKVQQLVDNESDGEIEMEVLKQKYISTEEGMSELNDVLDYMNGLNL